MSHDACVCCVVVVLSWCTDNVVAAWCFFLVLTWVHVWANIRALRCLVLSSLNQPRLKLLLQHYMAQVQGTAQGADLMGGEKGGRVGVVCQQWGGLMLHDALVFCAAQGVLLQGDSTPLCVCAVKGMLYSNMCACLHPSFLLCFVLSLQEKVYSPQQMSGLESLLVPPLAALRDWCRGSSSGVTFGARLTAALSATAAANRQPGSQAQPDSFGRELQQLLAQQPPASSRQYLLAITGSNQRVRHFGSRPPPQSAGIGCLLKASRVCESCVWECCCLSVSFRGLLSTWPLCICFTVCVCFATPCARTAAIYTHSVCRWCCTTASARRCS